MTTLLSLAVVAVMAAAPQAPIVNGAPDTSSRHWGVVLLQMQGGSAPGAMCTGTLITKDIVLTAAHCVDGNPSSIGVYFYGSNLNYPAAVRYADEYVQHPNWNPYRLTGDIALVHLSSAAPDGFDPIPPLPPSKAIGNGDDGNLVLTFVGYGLSNPYDHSSTGVRLTSQGVMLAHCDNPNGCYIGDRYQSQIQGGTIFYHQNDLQGDWAGPCSGDSGGPAFVVRDGVEYVAGVTSYGDQYCQYVGVSTKVDYYYDFIMSYLQQKGEASGSAGSHDPEPQPENCVNGADDDGDGKVDCADPDCAQSAACQPAEGDACSEAVVLSCGDEIQGTTVGAPSKYNLSGCLNGWTEDGPERAYYIKPPKGMHVTVSLIPADPKEDLDLFLLDVSDDTCRTDACLTGSVKGAGETEAMSFTADGLPYYVLVETYENPGRYTLRVECSTSSTHEYASDEGKGAEFSGDRIGDEPIDNEPGGVFSCAAAPAGTSSPFSMALVGLVALSIALMRRRSR